MTTKAFIHTIAKENTTANLQELNIFDSSFLLNYIENHIAAIEGGANSLASKSFRSARFTLLKRLSNKKAIRVLSFDSVESWKNDLDIYKRISVSIVYAQKFSERALAEILKSEKIDVLYLSTINNSTLAVENHSWFIAQAQSLNIPVVFDNTAGAFGSIFTPIALEADYSIINTTDSIFNKSGIGAFVTEGLPKKHSKDFLGVFGNSNLEVVKRKRTTISKRFLISEEEKSFADRLAKEIENQKAYSKNAFTVAKWLNKTEQVLEVNYPGLKTSASFQNAETHLKGGYGRIIKFKVWDSNFSHNLLRSSFVAGRPEGLEISVDNEAKEFTIEIKTEAVHKVLAYLERVFGQLSKELEYRAFLKKQIKLEAAFKEFLINNL